MVALVQKVSASGVGTPATANITGVTAGNFLTVQISAATYNLPGAPVDPDGGVWQVAYEPGVGGADCLIGYMNNAASGSHGVSSDVATLSGWTVTISEWSGMGTASHPSVRATNTFADDQSSGSHSGSSVVPAQTLANIGDLVLGTFSMISGGGESAAGITNPPTGFTSMVVQNNAGSGGAGNNGAEHCYLIAASTALPSTTWTANYTNGPTYLTGAIVSFVSAAHPGGILDLSPPFPECPGFGFTVEQRYMVKAIEREGGYERVDRRWTYPLTFITASPSGNRDAETICTIIDFWHAMGGQSGTFRFRDYTDYKSCHVQNTPSPSAPEQPFLALPNGNYQMVKEYIAAGPGSPGTFVTQVRPIYRPIGSTIAVFNTSGVLQTDWTLDETTGIVTPGGGFSGTPGGWSGEFDVWMRFNSDMSITITDGEESERIMSVTFTLREVRPDQP